MEDNDAAQAGAEPLLKHSKELISPEQVRSKIRISNHQLLELVHSEQKLLDRMNELNHQGVLQIQDSNYVLALMFFDECEKNLEYAASCGKTIDRNLIIAILNNKAVAYQRLQEHQKSASYVEAIIYNLKMFVESRQNQLLYHQLNLISTNLAQKHSVASFNQAQLASIHSFISRKFQLTVYLLQFSGLYSQCQSHQDSFKNAKLSLETMKELCLANYQLLIVQQNERNDTLKELSQLPLQFDKNQYQLLRNQFEKLNRISSQTKVSQDQMYLQKSAQEEVITFESVFSLKSKTIQQHILQSQIMHWDTLSHQNHFKKIILVICMYFTMGVQLEQIAAYDFESCNSIYMFGSQKKSEKQDIIDAEMYHLMALVIGLKHLSYSHPFLQNLISIYREHYSHQTIQSPLKKESDINEHLDKLTQKYKNYLIERDVSMSLDEDSSSLIKQVDPESQKKWNEQKKQSKKLNELLKQETPQAFINRGGQQSYFMQVPSIDSISMANSVSANRQDGSSIGQEKKYMHTKKGKINMHPKLKSSKTIGYQYESRQQEFYPTPPDSNNPISQRSREDQYYDSTKRQKKRTVNIMKSKSKSSKKNNSKTKLVETKKIEKNASNNVSSASPMMALMTTVTDRSSKKIKLKKSPQRSQKFMIGSAGGEANKWVGDAKKIASSDQIKSLKVNQFSSVKNAIEPIKMNKVKAPLKMIASIPINETKPSQTIRLQQRKKNSSSQKNKSKSKSSASFKSKKSQNNSKNKKNLSKTIKTSKQKIYTQIKHTIKRR